MALAPKVFCQGGLKASKRPRIALFATVQGPEVHYAQHVHKAPELYVVIGGSGDWQIGDGPFEPKGPGDWIWHPTGTRHASSGAR